MDRSQTILLMQAYVDDVKNDDKLINALEDCGITFEQVSNPLVNAVEKILSEFHPDTAWILYELATNGSSSVFEFDKDKNKDSSITVTTVEEVFNALKGDVDA